MVVLCMAPVTGQAGWGWGNKNKEVKKASLVEPKQESPELREALKKKKLEAKQAAIQQHREAQLAENQAFQQAMHDRQMAEMKAKLAQNTKLTEVQKNEILASREKQTEGKKAYQDQRRSEDAAFFQKLAEDPKMTEAKKREAIREHFQSQKPANKAFRQQQVAASQSEREKIRAEVPSAVSAAAE